MITRRVAIFLCLALLLWACTPRVGQCVDDGYCSGSELLIGECSDCKPDFIVKDVQLNFFGEGNQAELHYCIVNQNGEYEGPLDLWVHVGGTAQNYIQGQPLDYVVFKSAPAEYHSYVTEENGQYRVSFDARVGDQDEYWCNVLRLDREPSREYWVSIEIDPNRKISETNKDNNLFSQSFVTAYEEHYPHVLIEHDLWPYRYLYSDLWQWGSTGARFEARYDDDRYNTFAAVTQFPTDRDMRQDIQGLFDGLQEAEIVVSYTGLWTPLPKPVPPPSECRSDADCTAGAFCSDGWCEGMIVERPAVPAESAREEVAVEALTVYYPPKQLYYAKVYYRVSEAATEQVLDVSWLSGNTWFSTVIPIPLGVDVASALQQHSIIQAYASRYLPDGAISVPPNCPIITPEHRSNPDAIAICESLGGRYELVTLQSMVDSNAPDLEIIESCTVLDCILEQPLWLEIPGHSITHRKLDIEQESGVNILLWEIVYDGGKTDVAIGAVEEGTGSDAISQILNDGSFGSFAYYEPETKVFYFSEGALWSHDNLVFLVDSDELDDFAEINMVLDFERFLKSLGRPSSEILAAYLSRYPSDLEPFSGSCPVVNSRQFVRDCASLGGSPTTKQYGTCVVPLCDFKDAEGQACPVQQLTPELVDACTARGAGSYFTPTVMQNGCPVFLCQPTSCPLSDLTWISECVRSGMSVTAVASAEGCFNYECSSCPVQATAECPVGTISAQVPMSNGCWDIKCYPVPKLG